MLTVTHESLPPILLRVGDRLSETWLRRSCTPYLAEIEEVAKLLREPGGYALNLTFEWGCTTCCAQTSPGTAMTLYRTLDWLFRLGSDVVVAQHRTDHGPYFNITWPGYVGVLTAMAPGRFAAAINQAPLRYSLGTLGLTMPVDWLVNRLRIKRCTAVPPAHLLREAFETCENYQTAKEVLTKTPICVPVIFCLTGGKAGEGCIIERTEQDAIVHDGSGVVTNHWLTEKFRGRPRPPSSAARFAKMHELLFAVKGDLDWVVPPILNSYTRIAVELNAGEKSAIVQGWHGNVPMTHVFRIGATLRLHDTSSNVQTAKIPTLPQSLENRCDHYL